MSHSCQSRLVAVTGLGTVCALGLTLDQSLARAKLGQSGLRRYEGQWLSEATQALRCRVGGCVDAFDPSRYIDPNYINRYDPAVLFGLAAGEEAMHDARLEAGSYDSERFGCVMGSGLPGAELWHRALHSVYAQQKGHQATRLAAVGITASSAPGALAMRLGLRGPSFGVGNACASSISSISIAADQITLGRADRMLAGGIEASMRSLLCYASFIEAGMNVTDEPDGACTPFARNRRGFVLGEGAGVLVLERLDLALARRAPIYAVLAGHAHANDAHHVISPEPSGAAWAKVMHQALAAAGDSPAEVGMHELDTVCAHGSGTPLGDLAETRALKLALGKRARGVAISATKAMHGHAFGASGAIETTLALAAMRDAVVLPTIHLREPDPECDLDYVPQVARSQPTRVLMKNAFGAGGVAACLVFRNGRAYV